MKNKNIEKIFLGLRTLFLVVFIFAEFFSFGFLPKASAACTYDTQFDVNPKTVAVNAKVTVTTIISVGGTETSQGKVTACTDSVNSVILVYSTSQSSTVKSSADITIPIVNGQGRDTRQLDFSEFFTANGRTKGTGLPVQFPVTSIKIQAKTYTIISNQYGTRRGTNVNSSGQIPVTLTSPTTPPDNNPDTEPPDNNPQTEPPNNNVDDQNNNSIIDCQATPDKCLYNPLPTDELTTIFLWIARGFLGIVAIWSVIFIIVGGFRMVMSQGNEEAYTTAKKTVTWAVLGLLIALLSFSIVAIVTNLIGADIQETRLIKP